MTQNISASSLMSSQWPQQTDANAQRVLTPPESQPKPTLEPHQPASSTLLDVFSPPSTSSEKSYTPILPRVERCLILIREYIQGVVPEDPGQTWLTVPLSPAEYREVEDALTPEEQGWVEDKLRFDYDPRRGGGEFVLRMPAPSHCRFAFSLSMEIVKALRNLPPQGHRQRAKLAEVLRKIGCGSTSDVYFQAISETSKKPYNKKSPDSSFDFSGCKYPPLVIEVANSQKSKDLPRLAQTYIVRSRRQTRTVLTVDLEYRSPKQRASLTSKSLRAATYSLYRYRSYERNCERIHTVDIDVDNKHFRSQNGQPCDGTLSLRLSDFCPPEALDGLEDLSIDISHEKLAWLLTEAEAREDEAATPDIPEEAEPPLIWELKWKHSPTPKLMKEDEAVQKALEDAAEQYMEKEDSSYYPSCNLEQPEAEHLP